MSKSLILKLTQDTKFEVVEDIDLILDLSETVNPVRLELVFETAGVSCHLIGMYVVKENQEIDLKTIAKHIARNTSCQQDVRGILKNSGVSKYLGSIVIEKEASHTSSFLDNHVLVIGDGTKNVSEPILEIKNNDVKASHGSTTGRIDENKVYYLCSRGLDRKEAENLIIEGFFEGLTNQIRDESVREEVRRKLLSQL
jgi:Fe-S cluster assembly protein SufD